MSYTHWVNFRTIYHGQGNVPSAPQPWAGLTIFIQCSCCCSFGNDPLPVGEHVAMMSPQKINTSTEKWFINLAATLN